MNTNERGRALITPDQNSATHDDEPVVADTIIFATNPREARDIATSMGLAFDEVQWYRSPDLLGEVDVSESTIKYSPSYTHRQDYARTRDRVKLKTGKGRRANPAENRPSENRRTSGS